jgi:hypothetical protein
VAVIVGPQNRTVRTAGKCATLVHRTLSVAFPVRWTANFSKSTLQTGERLGS